MTKEEFLLLYKQWSNETAGNSFHDTNHLAYIKLKAGGKQIIPWVLERLKDSVGHNSGNSMDRDNSPWLSVCLLGDLTDRICFTDFPKEHAGRLVEIREFLLKWGEAMDF